MVRKHRSFEPAGRPRFHGHFGRSVAGFLLLAVAASFTIAGGAVPQSTVLAAPPPRPTATPGSGGGTPLSITVSNTKVGISQQMVGAVEGNGGFKVADLTELGINNYRMYGGASRYEPVDDGGIYGSPTIAEIKANPDVINWAAWDAQFNRTDGYFWSLYANGAQVSSASMLSQLKTAGIQVVMTVRPRDNHNTPTWIAAVPITAEADRNEWWEHVFAMVYQVNVRNNWGVDRWEIHNEPNQTGQGWADNGGSLTNYYEFARLTADAINYVYSTYLTNRPHWIHSPVISGNPNRTKWSPGVLDNVDNVFNVFDYHWYGNNQGDVAAGYIADVSSHNPDGVIEPLFNSEWGTYRDTYNTVAQGLLFADQLYQMNLPASYVMGSQIFSMYSWGTAEGLVNDQGVKSETYWALKTLIPAIQGGKDVFSITGNSTAVKLLATKDATGVYLVAINRSTSAYHVSANISAHRTTGTGTLTQYSATAKAAVVGNPVVTNGTVSFSVPANSEVVLRVP